MTSKITPQAGKKETKTIERFVIKRPLPVLVKDDPFITSVNPSSEYYTCEPHPYRPGYHLTFPNGERFSLVDLNQLSFDQEKLPAHVREEELKFIDESRDTLEKLGGMFEAICISESLDSTWRGHSFQEVIDQLIKRYLFL